MHPNAFRFNHNEQDSSRMRTGRNSSHLPEGVCLSACWDTTPQDPWDQAPHQDQGVPRPSPPPDQAPPLGSRPPPDSLPGPSCGQTDRYKNITFATSLRTVIKTKSKSEICVGAVLESRECQHSTPPTYQNSLVRSGWVPNPATVKGLK